LLVLSDGAEDRGVIGSGGTSSRDRRNAQRERPIERQENEGNKLRLLNGPRLKLRKVGKNAEWKTTSVFQ